MTTFLYDVKTLTVEASGQFILPTVPPGKAVARLNCELVPPLKMAVNQHPNPSYLVVNPHYGRRLEVTLTGTTSLDFDNTPVALADGVSIVTVEVLLKDQRGAVVSTTGGRFRILGTGACALREDEIQLRDGRGTVLCGPTTTKGDCQLEFVDPAGVIERVKIRLRWR